MIQIGLQQNDQQKSANIFYCHVRNSVECHSLECSLTT